MPARLLTTELLPECCDELASADRLAIDTEFHAERRYVPKLFLVQAYVAGGNAWIIDPLQPDLLESVAPVLRTVPWLAHGGSQDIRLLDRALGGTPELVLDTQIGAGLQSARFPEGYGSLMQRYLHRTLPKSATLSDWSRRPLSDEQLQYATDDVLRLPDLWAAIERGLDELGRVELAHRACREARDRHRKEPDPREAWRHFGAAQGMSWRARSVLRELTTWREALAQERNQPPRTILGDGSIVELSKRTPKHRDGISANRRFPRSAQKHVSAIWEAIERGRDTQEKDAPACPERFSAPWRALQAMRAWALQCGHEQRFSARLALDEPLMGRLLLEPPRQRDELSARLGPWRDELLGEELWDWVAGTSHLAMVPSTSSLALKAPV